MNFTTQSDDVTASRESPLRARTRSVVRAALILARVWILIIYSVALPSTSRFADWVLMAVNTVVLYLLMVHRAPLSSLVYVWTPAAWLAWFLYATGAVQRRPQTAAAALVNTPELEEAGV